MDKAAVKKLLLERDPAFWPQLARATEDTAEFAELFSLSAMRKRALATGWRPPDLRSAPLRLAIIGGCSLHPLDEIVVHLLHAKGVECELFLGEYDNYVAEISDPGSALY